MSRRRTRLKAGVVARRVADLYAKPFRLCDFGLYVFDANGEVVADFGGPQGAFRTRGWGRIQYMRPHPDVLFDCADAAFGLLLVGMAPWLKDAPHRHGWPA